MNIATHIRENVYLKERLSPSPGESTYLHLSDLRQALEKIKTDQPIAILDYGCGGSPYKSLFPNAVYKRADFPSDQSDRLDYELKEDSLIKEADATFDLILSTQVLEHVGSPAGYLSECHRLLKRGGRLYLTTHGSYPDHACPYDFWRWTADGLVREVSRAGFSRIEPEKLTTGARALFQEIDIELDSLRLPKNSAFGIFLFLTRKIYCGLRPWIHRMSDRHFVENKVVRHGLDRHRTYMIAGCLAYK